MARKRAEREAKEIEAPTGTVVRRFVVPATVQPLKKNRAALGKSLAKVAADLGRTSAPASTSAHYTRGKGPAVDLESEEEDLDCDYEEITPVVEPASPPRRNPALRIFVAGTSNSASPASSSATTRETKPGVIRTETPADGGLYSLHWSTRIEEVTAYRRCHWLKPLTSHDSRHNLIGNLRHYLARELPLAFGIIDGPNVFQATHLHALSYINAELSFI